jgi:hypothetical protein
MDAWKNEYFKDHTCTSLIINSAAGPLSVRA